MAEVAPKTELTGPYYHNGGQATLEQVIQFYDRGGDFREENIANVDPKMRDLNLTDEEKAELVAFLKALTDERVKYEKGPFDHPEIFVPNGSPVYGPKYLPRPIPDRFVSGKAVDNIIHVPAVGRTGRRPARQPFMQ